MSLLQIKNDPLHEHDASSDGEDLAKGSSYLLWTTIVAFVLVTVGIGAFLLANRKPPVAAGEVVEAWAHSVHTLTTPTDANGVRGPSEQFDQVLVFASIRVRNQSDQPIVLKDMLTNATFPDGIHNSYAAGTVDFDRIFIAYPELKGLRGQPLLRETLVAPGQAVNGMIASSFHVTQEQWKAMKDLNFTVEFKLHPDLVLAPKGPLVER